MPIYEYQCQQCSTKFEALRSMKDADSEIACTKCASTDTRRALSVCYCKGENRSSSSSHAGCGSCSGGSCASCGH